MKTDTASSVGGRHDLVGVGACVLAAVLLGMAVAVSRFAFEGGANGVAVATLRCVLATAGLAAFFALSGRRMRLPLRLWLHCAGNGVLFSMMAWGNIGSVEFIPVGLAALLFFTYPPLVAGFSALLFGEPLPPAKLAALLLAFGGLALMLGVSFQAYDLRGIAMALAAAVTAATNAIWVGRRLKGVHGLLLTMHITGIAALVLVALSLSTGVFRLPTEPGGWTGLAGVVLLQSVGIPLYFVSLQHIGATRATMITNVQPVVSIVAAFLLFGELLSAVQMLGGALVLGGIWLMQWTDARRGGSRPTTPEPLRGDRRR